MTWGRPGPWAAQPMFRCASLKEAVSLPQFVLTFDVSSVDIITQKIEDKFSCCFWNGLTLGHTTFDYILLVICFQDFFFILFDIARCSIGGF